LGKKMIAELFTVTPRDIDSLSPPLSLGVTECPWADTWQSSLYKCWSISNLQHIDEY